MHNKIFFRLLILKKKMVPVSYDPLIFLLMVWTIAIQPGKLTIQIDFWTYFNNSLELFYLDTTVSRPNKLFFAGFSTERIWRLPQNSAPLTEILRNAFWVAHSPVLSEHKRMEQHTSFMMHFN